MGNNLPTSTLGVMLKGFHRHLAERLRTVHRLSDEAIAADLASLGLRFHTASEARIQWLCLMSTLQAHLSMFLIEPPLTPTVSATVSASPVAPPPPSSLPSLTTFELPPEFTNAASRVALNVLQGMFSSAEPAPEQPPLPPPASSSEPRPPVPEAVVEDPDSDSDDSRDDGGLPPPSTVAAAAANRSVPVSAAPDSHSSLLTDLLAHLPENLPIMQVAQSHPELFAQMVQTLQSVSALPRP